MAWVGCVSHFYYQFHLTKFHDKKTDLTREIARFGDDLLQTNRQLKILGSSNLTKYTMSFKTTGKNIRVDKSTVEEVLGTDTLYRLSINKKQASKPANSASGRKSGILNAPTIAPRKKPNNTYEESDSDPEMEEVDDYNGHTRKRKATKSNSVTIPRQKKRNTDESESRGEIEEVDARKRKATKSKSVTIPRQKKLNTDESESRGEIEEVDEVTQAKSDESDGDTYYKHLCNRLTDKVIDMISEIKSLKSENVLLKHELAKAHKPMKNNQEKSGDEEGNESRESNLLAGTNIEPAKDLPANWKERSVKMKWGMNALYYKYSINSDQSC
jgi:hypothetical protein